jgi:hypothetical protein
VTRLLAAAALLALVVSGAALAAVAEHGEPKRKIVAADRARAKAMLVKRSDLPAGFKTSRPEPDTGHPYCKAVDESDLTLTGEAEIPGFEKPLFFVSSISQVYASGADANTSWRRGTSSAGLRCVRRLYAQELKEEGATVRSFRTLAFPKLAQRTVALRMLATAQGVTVVVDLVALQQGRAHSTLVFVSALAPVPKAEQHRLARVVAGRMVKAMRGA